MWYKSEISKNIDGLEPFLALFAKTEDFYKHLFENIYFFKKSDVEQQALQMLNKISNNEKLPVRFTLKCEVHYRMPNMTNARGFSKKKFKNKKDAQEFAENNELVHHDTGINVCVDKDGNYYVRKEIENLLGYKVSTGAKSEIVNYVISHVFAETQNPLFFTSLWNIVFIPNYLSYILDKPNENCALVRKVKSIVKAACFDIYNPNYLLNKELIDEDEELKKSITAFRELRDRNFITLKFLEKKNL
jgi:hypothetical protein